MNCHIDAVDGSVTGVCRCGGIAVYEGEMYGGSEIVLSCGSCDTRYRGFIPPIEFLPIKFLGIDEEAELVGDLT